MGSVWTFLKSILLRRKPWSMGKPSTRGVADPIIHFPACALFSHGRPFPPFPTCSACSFCHRLFAAAVAANLAGEKPGLEDIEGLGRSMN